MTRSVRWLAIATVGAIALTGCMRMTVDTEVSSDDTYSQHVVIAYSDAIAQQMSNEMGIDASDMFDELRDSPEVLDLQERYPGQIDLAPYDDGELRGVEMTTTDLPLEAMSDAGELTVAATATLKRVGDQFILELPVTDELAGLSDMGLTSSNISMLENSVDVAVTYTFPGLVESASAGTVEGRTVTFGLSDLVMASEDIRVVADANPGIDWAPILRWGLFALAFLLVVGGATALVIQDRRKRSHTSLPPPVTSEATGPGVLTPDPEVRP